MAILIGATLFYSVSIVLLVAFIHGCKTGGK